MPVRGTNTQKLSLNFQTSLITEVRHYDILQTECLLQKIMVKITAQSMSCYFLDVHFILGGFPVFLANQSLPVTIGLMQPPLTADPM